MTHRDTPVVRWYCLSIMAPDRSRPVERPETVWLGEQIRTRRRGRFSLETLAKRAGISSGLLSEIERGKGNPSFATLLKLAEALEMDPSDFFRFKSSSWRDDHVVRKPERQSMSFPDGRLIEVLSPRLDFPIVMWKSIYPRGFDGRTRPYTVAAETCLFLIRGELIVEDQQRDACHLGPGDSLRLEAGTTFTPQNPGPDEAESIESSTLAPL